MTITTILDRLGMKEGNKDYWTAHYGQVFNIGNATRKDVSNYIKKCLLLNKKLTLETIDKILSNEVGTFWHYWGSESLHPYDGDYDYIDIDKDGSICVWCECDGFRAYLMDYLRKWFTDKEYELMKPFFKALGFEEEE